MSSVRETERSIRNTETSIRETERSIRDTARACKALEDQYLKMRQTVGLETLRAIQTQMAQDALRVHLAKLQDECRSVGGHFASELARAIENLPTPKELK